MDHELLRHVIKGNIKYRNNGQPYISGAHHSYHFLRRVAEYAANHDGMFVKVRPLFPLNERDSIVFDVEYQTTGNDWKTKSLYNPDYFTQGELYEYAHEAFENKQYLSNLKWEGEIYRAGNTYVFQGHYEMGLHHENITTFYLKEVTTNNN